MIDILKPHFEQRQDGDLTTEERNVLCVAYKNAVGMRRIAWRAAKAARKIPKYKRYEEDMQKYVKKLEEELVNMCKDMLNLISKHFLPKAKRAGAVESEVFYLKLQGDYFRYVAEVGEGERLEKATERALDSYNRATERADSGNLSPADPTRLSLLLNFAVFCHETLHQKDQAIQMATQAYEEGTGDLASLDRSKAQESANVLEFIRENIGIWKGQRDQQALHKKNMFSQQDSEAQFINADDDEEEDEEGHDDEEYGEY